MSDQEEKGPVERIEELEASVSTFGMTITRLRRMVLGLIVLLVVSLTVQGKLIDDQGNTADRAASTAKDQARVARTLAKTVHQLTAVVQRSQLEYLRNCIRANVNAAVIHKRAQHPIAGAPGVNIITVQIADALYPILDCKQSLLRGESVQLNEEETVRYADIVAGGRAPIIANGHVLPQSRKTLLDGVRSVEQAGHP